MTEDACLAGATLTLIEPVIKKVKGEERTVHHPCLSVDVGGNVMNFDAGAALLRGLDLPQFRKHLKATLKERHGLAIRDYWSMWLQEMHNGVLLLTDAVLDIVNPHKDKSYGLALFESDADAETTEIISTEGKEEGQGQEKPHAEEQARPKEG